MTEPASQPDPAPTAPADAPVVCHNCRCRGLNMEASTKHVRFCGDVSGVKHYVCDGCGRAFTVPLPPPPVPCPYAGCSEPESLHMGGDRQSVFFVYCDGCGACGPRKRSHLAAVEAWNAVAGRTAEAERAAKMRSAIEWHHSQKADDRCWMDDQKLYEAAGLPVPDLRVGDKAAMLRNCERFIHNRCAGGGWQSYAELEAERDAIRDEARKNIDAHKRLIQAMLFELVGDADVDTEEQAVAAVRALKAERDEANALKAEYYRQCERALLDLQAAKETAHEEWGRRVNVEAERDRLRTQLAAVARHEIATTQ